MRILRPGWWHCDVDEAGPGLPAGWYRFDEHDTPIVFVEGAGPDADGEIPHHRELAAAFAREDQALHAAGWVGRDEAA